MLAGDHMSYPKNKHFLNSVGRAKVTLTELRHIEEDLRESEQRLEAALQTVGIAYSAWKILCRARYNTNRARQSCAMEIVRAEFSKRPPTPTSPESNVFRIDRRRRLSPGGAK